MECLRIFKTNHKNTWRKETHKHTHTCLYSKYSNIFRFSKHSFQVVVYAGYTPKLNDTVICIFVFYPEQYIRLTSPYLPGIIFKKLCVCNLASGWTVRESTPGGGEIFCTHPEHRWGSPSLLCNGYRVIPGVKQPYRGADHPPPSSAKV
jgi:hypothetical protein